MGELHYTQQHSNTVSSHILTNTHTPLPSHITHPHPHISHTLTDNTEVISALLAKGADPVAKDNEGMTRESTHPQTSHTFTFHTPSNL